MSGDLTPQDLMGRSQENPLETKLGMKTLETRDEAFILNRFGKM